MLPDKLYYNIREVSEHLQVSPSLLRFWEKEFPHLATKRNSRGVRFYTRQNVLDLEVLYQLIKEQGYTLEGARSYLKKNKKSIPTEAENLKQTLTEVRDLLEKFKRVLHEVD